MWLCDCVSFACHPPDGETDPWIGQTSGPIPHSPWLRPPPCPSLPGTHPLSSRSWHTPLPPPTRWPPGPCTGPKEGKSDTRSSTSGLLFLLKLILGYCWALTSCCVRAERGWPVGVGPAKGFSEWSRSCVGSEASTQVCVGPVGWRGTSELFLFARTWETWSVTPSGRWACVTETGLWKGLVPSPG